MSRASVSFEQLLSTFSPSLTRCELRCRFSELEALVALTMILQKYKVTVKQEPQYAGETLAQTHARIVDCEQYLTVK